MPLARSLSRCRQGGGRIFIVLCLAAAISKGGAAITAGNSALSAFPNGESGVMAPPNGSDIIGNTPLTLRLPGVSKVEVRCWKQGPGYGADSLVATALPNQEGATHVNFPADSFPHGPITIRLGAQRGGQVTNYYLQVYNRGGVRWNEGLPSSPPPAAAHFALVFADDFTQPLSISEADPTATYGDHKPGGGDFGQFHFASCHSPSNPFTQMDSYLRIRASAATRTDGLISSLKGNGTGFKVGLPCYFECRLLAPSAPGTWPAFWLMTDYSENGSIGAKGRADELDVIEAYGGEGARNPNSKGKYRITSHFWHQGVEGKKQKGIGRAVDMRALGGKASWWETFHTYGCKITDTDTVYYCDHVEVGRHPTGAMSKTQPLFFMVNLAVGGNGWPVDLTSSGGVADMYIDYIRVYKGPGSPVPVP